MAATKKSENEVIENIAIDPWQEMVTVMLPLDEEHQKALFVCVNGRNFLIPRGVEYSVPKPIYEAVIESQTADREALNRRMNLINNSQFS